jgi:myo-inositol 2-dehydrogenase / D-chiro-inositol 1-dehydrogenase
MIEICQFGAGRIGKMHAANLDRHPGYCLRYVVDTHAPSAREVASAYDAEVATTEQALADPAVDAVLIASSTDTHAGLIEAAARAGKAILCEKPIDLAMARVDACLAVADAAGVPLMVGFNRRFDRHFQALKQAIEQGRVGTVELVSITSRDPGPPPAAYIKVSGGLYRDMMIHDFDLARWLLGEEPCEVLAAGSCLVDDEIGKLGDVDTALVIMKTPSGKLCQISCSRRATYGYDQRVEVLGSKGMVRAENVRLSAVEIADDHGFHGEKPPHFFIDRYAEAYLAELDHFAACLEQGTAPSPSGEDGRRALALADAATESRASGRAVTPVGIA